MNINKFYKIEDGLDDNYSTLSYYSSSDYKRLEKIIRDNWELEIFCRQLAQNKYPKNTDKYIFIRNMTPKPLEEVTLSNFEYVGDRTEIIAEQLEFYHNTITNYLIRDDIPEFMVTCYSFSTLLNILRKRIQARIDNNVQEDKMFFVKEKDIVRSRRKAVRYVQQRLYCVYSYVYAELVAAISSSDAYREEINNELKKIDINLAIIECKVRQMENYVLFHLDNNDIPKTRKSKDFPLF